MLTLSEILCSFVELFLFFFQLLTQTLFVVSSFQHRTIASGVAGIVAINISTPAHSLVQRVEVKKTHYFPPPTPSTFSLRLPLLPHPTNLGLLPPPPPSTPSLHLASSLPLLLYRHLRPRETEMFCNFPNIFAVFKRWVDVISYLLFRKSEVCFSVSWW